MSRVLLVSDERRLREQLAGAIASGPHTVRAVAAGDLRVEAARDWEPDVIVMDLSPDGAALQLRIGMLRDPDLAHVPFVVVGDSEDEARALGAHAFVRVPVPIAGLLDLIARFAAARMPLPT